MQAHDSIDLDGCLDLAEQCGEPIELRGNARPEDLYRRIHLEFVHRFGDPDDSFIESHEKPNATIGTFAAWDFDYYQLFLRLERQLVTLHWHSST